MLARPSPNFAGWTSRIDVVRCLGSVRRRRLLHCRGSETVLDLLLGWRRLGFFACERLGRVESTDPWTGVVASAIGVGSFGCSAILRAPFAVSAWIKESAVSARFGELRV